MNHETTTAPDLFRKILTDHLKINDHFSIAEILSCITRHYGKKAVKFGNYSSVIKGYIKSGIIEDTTPEKGRYKIYKYANPIHGYKTDKVVDPKLTVTIEVTSLNELTDIATKYSIIKVQGA